LEGAGRSRRELMVTETSMESQRGTCTRSKEKKFASNELTIGIIKKLLNKGAISKTTKIA